MLQFCSLTSAFGSVLVAGRSESLLESLDWTTQFGTVESHVKKVEQGKAFGEQRTQCQVFATVHSGEGPRVCLT